MGNSTVFIGNSQNMRLPKEFIHKLENQKGKTSIPRTDKLSIAQANKINQDIKKEFGLDSRLDSIAVLAVFFQQGATARKCDGNMTITIFEKTIKLAQIRKILKENQAIRQERKLARTFANEIYEVAVILNLPGNLYKKILRNNPDLSLETLDKYWLSDFQSENEECPWHLRKLIIDQFTLKTSTKKK